MYETGEIFSLLSKEKKDLKPDHKYKTCEEGLMKALHFFRWCKKTEVKDADKVVELFIKKKIPEQQVEHFGAALVMIEHYDTHDIIKSALKYINDQVIEKTGKPILDSIEPPRVERRILKNIYTSLEEAVERLKTRSISLKKSYKGFWLTILTFFILNVSLVGLGIYNKLILHFVPEAYAGKTLLGHYGGLIVAAVLFFIPSLLVLFLNRHKLSEHNAKGSDYPEEIQKMEETLEAFAKKLAEKKINVKNARGK